MKTSTLLTVLVVGTLQSVVSAAVISPDQQGADVITIPLVTLDTATYTGTVKVFLAEPSSRWLIGGIPYRNGVLDCPLIDTVEIPPYGSWYGSATWDASATMFGSIDSANIVSAAAVYNSQGDTLDYMPPYEYYLFTAHFVDASAWATIGQPSIEPFLGDYTHQVFVETVGTYGT